MTISCELGNTGMQGYLYYISFHKGAWTLPLRKGQYGNKPGPLSILHLLLSMGGTVRYLIADTHLVTLVR